MLEESEEGVTVIRQGGKLQERELPRTLNLERKSCEHLRWTHLEQAQHCTDLPRQVTFPVHTEQGKDGARVGMNVTAHQEKEENEDTKKGKRGAGEKKKRKQATDFKEAVCCPSAGGSIAKK